MKREAHAFSLLEVLVALAIFGLVAGVLAQACANALNTLDSHRREPTDEAFFRFAMRTAMAIEDRDELENGGDIRMPDERMLVWTANIHETSVIDLFAVNFTFELEGHTRFFGNDSGRQRLESVYAFRPQWSDPVERSALLQDKREALSASRPLR